MSMDDQIQALAARIGAEFAALPSGGPSNVVIGTVQPTPATGVSVMWLDTSSGSSVLKIVTGD